MDNYLIFRNDRIGDFFLTAILIKSIKRNNPNSIIDIVTSKKNNDYIKTFEFVDNVILLKNNIIDKIKFIFKIRKKKYNHIIVHDNKNRSIILSKFCIGNKVILINNIYSNSHLTIIKKILSELNFDFINEDLNFLENRNFETKYNKEKHTLIHFDEKWIYNEYIKEFNNIEPSEDELIEFINEILIKTKSDLVISTGIKTPIKLQNIMSKIKSSKISFVDNLSFIELEKILSNTNLLISCHGAISHISAAKNIRQIDIIDKSKKEFYQKWTSHFRNYNYLYRNKFKILKNEILSLL